VTERFVSHFGHIAAAIPLAMRTTFLLSTQGQTTKGAVEAGKLLLGPF
jgi:hypothetical protein